MVARADIVDADDGDDFFELLADLLEHAVVADDDERHPREARVFGFADGEAIDVVAARGEHAGHVGQHAGHVLDGGGKDVTHGEGLGAGDWGLGTRNYGRKSPSPRPSPRWEREMIFGETTMIYGVERGRNRAI